MLPSPLKSLSFIFGANDGDSLKLRFVNNTQSFCLGKIGMPTKYTDRNGNRIHVGDIVSVYDEQLNKVTWEHYVCYSKNTSDNKVFGEYVFSIMGKYDCAQNKGVLHESYEKLTIIKSHKNAKHGDRIDLVHVLKVNDEKHPESRYDRVDPERPTSCGFKLIRQADKEEVGAWGHKTAFSDCFGIKLHVGDVVGVYDEKNDYLGAYYVGVKPRFEQKDSEFRYDYFSVLILGLSVDSFFSKKGFDCKIHRMERMRKFEDVCVGESHLGYICLKKD